MRQNHLPARTIFVLLVNATLHLTWIGYAGGEDAWVRKADMPTARHGVCTCMLNGKIYAIGGVNRPGIDVEVLRTIEEYDPATDSWVTKSEMPTSRNWAACATVNGKIYVIGGDRTFLSTPRKTVEEYDPASDTWTPKADMPTARSALVAAAVDGKIYAIGGLTTVGTPPLGTVEVYDPVSNAWERKANMPTPRGMAGAAVVDGKIFVIGSFFPPSGPALGVVEMYDPQTDVWTRKANMPTARGGLGCGAVQGRIYAVGGRVGNTLLVTVEEYNPPTDAWVKRAAMSDTDPESPDQRWGLAVSGINERLYALGGAAFTQPPYTTLSLVLEYTPPPLAPDVQLQIKRVTRDANIFARVEWPSHTGFLDRLQMRSQLQNAAWTEVETLSGNGEILTKEIPAGGHSAFYRLQRELR